MKTLDLVLKKQWYDMIASGEKKEEYREIKPYWIGRLADMDDRDDNCSYYSIKRYDRVTFHLGYSKDRPSMTFAIKDITIAEGKPEWGAKEGIKYFVIRLGRRIMTRDEYYIEQALRYSQRRTLLDKEALAFVAGMKMADEHPNWVNVEDELPDNDATSVLRCPHPTIHASEELFLGFYDGEAFYTTDRQRVYPTHYYKIFWRDE